MQKNVCDLCGYVYEDPPEGGKPDKPFGDLPASWVCPMCGAAKDKFYSVNQ